MQMLCLSPLFLGAALASMPVYIVNADIQAPQDYTLAAQDFAGVVAHFIGANDLASQGALDAAQFVPGTFMDARKSSAVLIADFMPEDSSVLGPSVMSVDEVQAPREADVSTPLSGSAALKALKSLDSVDSQTLLVSAKGIQAEILEVLQDTSAKLLVLGVQRGKAVPAFKVGADAQSAQSIETEAQAASSKSKKSPFLLGAFATLNECEKSTSNCSGHGSCVKAGGSFSCACEATTKDGYTTYWGGNACEKRDVSWQFNLLLWTGAGILIAVIAGVSLLFSIDSQPLPGVLNVQ